MMIAQYGWIERKKNLMVVYGYSCENNNCQHKFEIEQHMTDDALVECPCCKCSTLIRIIYAPMVFSKGEPTTIGHQADRNTQKLGHYEYEDKMQERKSRIRKASDQILKETGGKSIEHNGELPWWRSGKVDGLPKRERPISPQEVDEISKEFNIRVRPPKPKPKK